MIKTLSLLPFISLFFYASCSPAAPETTPPPVMKRTLDNDPAFRGYTSTLGSWSPLYCNGDYTYSTFGNIADCCTLSGVCHPATDCAIDYEGSTRAIKYQGGETLTCIDTTCGTQTVYKTEGDSKPLSVYGCFAAGKLYLTTPGSPALASASNSAATSSSRQSSRTISPSSASSTAAAVPAKKSTSHIGLIAGGAAIGVVLLLLIAGLIAWIIILKKRNGTAKPSKSTELQKMQGEGKGLVGEPTVGFKAELPTNEGWAVELPPESAPASRQEQKPWSNLNAMPQSPAPNYSPAPPYEGTAGPFLLVGGNGGGSFSGEHSEQHSGIAELPGARTHHQELPGSTSPQCAELG